MPDLVARRPGRRLLLAGVGAVLLAPVSGCGIRLEDDAPRLPLVPTREPLAGETALVALTRDCLHLADLAEALATPLGRDLATLHRRQHTVLRTTLAARRVPAADLDATASPTASATGSATGSATATPTTAPTPRPTVPPASSLGAAEAEAAAGASRFSAVAADLLPPLAALHAQRWAAARLLTGTAPARPVSAGPPHGADSDALVAAADTATYLAEVGTARSTGARRRRAEATLAALRDLVADLRSGEDPPQIALGHPLPFPVRTAADVDRLFLESLTSLRATLGGGLAGLVGADPVAGLVAGTCWLGVVEVEAHRWGAPLAPFPGLT